MGSRILKPFVLMLGGTSLTSGRLCNPPIPWTQYLYDDMIGAAECQGPVIIINTGKGSQTSDFGASQAALMAPLRPTHVLMEDFAINDCAIGPVSIPQATANFNSMVASYRAARSDVVIVHQTMSPAAATDASRVNLPTYYTNGLTNAALNGLISLDNYGGTAIVPGGWVKPLPNNLTVGFGGLANIPSGFTYLFGTINPADKDANLTLSGGNLKATRGAGGVYASARNTVSFSSGKYYFEATINTAVTGEIDIGICQATLALNSYVGSTATGWGYRALDGRVYNNGVSVGTFSTYGTGDVVGVAVDLTNNRVWFRKGTGNWNGSPTANPTTNVGGLAITAGTYFAGLTIQIPGEALTMAFGTPGDDLHPVWANAFQTYSYPNILPWAKQAMADFW